MQQNFAELIIPIVLIIILWLTYRRIKVNVLKSYSSKISGKIEVIERKNKERVLTTNGYTQGISINHPTIKNSYWYKIAEVIINHCKTKKNPHLLFFGLGANTSSLLIAKSNPKIHQTIIEIDEMIIQANIEFFYLNELPKSQIINADAYKIVDNSQIFKNKFEAIVIDIFGYKYPFIIEESNHPKFIKKITPLLTKDGILVFNTHANNPKNAQISQELKRFLITIFPSVDIIEVNDKTRGYVNNIVVSRRSLAH